MYGVPDEKYRLKKREEYLSQGKSLSYIEIGKSILGRSIDCFKIGRGKRAILAVGAHHALEYQGASALYAFIDFLVKKATRPPSFQPFSVDFLLSGYCYYVIPCLNPDGVEMHLNPSERNILTERALRMSGGSGFSDWQSNARGVDLNHNYDFGFEEYKKLEEELGICAGKSRYSGLYPESEPETRALASFTRILMPSLAVSFHSQGREIFYSPKTARTERTARRICSLVSYKIASPSGTNAYGGFCDYTGGALGIPSFTVELCKGKNPLPETALLEAVTVTRKILIALPSMI